MLKINEIYFSIQGESSNAGLPCVFIRLTGCNLRCTYCDTEYAFYEGKDFSVSDIVAKVGEYDCTLVEITGGEPLVQDEECRHLMSALCEEGYEVMLETGGSLPIKGIDSRVKIIMDLKCPSSGMMKKNDYDNIGFLKQNDEVKFVMGSREDYEWTLQIIKQYQLEGKCSLLFSVVFGKLEPLTLVNWMLQDKVKARFQLQVHKFIWQPDTKGV